MDCLVSEAGIRYSFRDLWGLCEECYRQLREIEGLPPEVKVKLLGTVKRIVGGCSRCEKNGGGHENREKEIENE